MSRSLSCGLVALATFVVLSAAHPFAARAQEDEREVRAVEEEILGLDAMFPAMAAFPWTEKDKTFQGVLYGDTKGIVHFYIFDSGKFREKWRSFPLDGVVKEVYAQDLNRDGSPEIIAYSAKARIYVWDTKTFRVLWESVQENFKSIQAMTIADVDRDAQLELVICANNKLVYIDGVEFFREKEGRDPLDPSVLLVADVDGDLTNEIVSNDGYVFDTTTLNIEWATETFGYPLTLFDIDNDGIFEVLGETLGSIVIWSIQDRRQIW
jgi:hypothetical protein